MKRVPLTRGYVALVDDADYEAVMAAGPWYALVKADRQTVYAQRNIRRSNGERSGQYMHKFLTGWDQTDHRNGDGLDNQRDNLRPATGSENNRNSRLRKDNTSGFKGVQWDKQRRRWVAGIRVSGRQRQIGSYDNPVDAAHAYDAAARELFGAFARPNFPVAELAR